MRYKVSVITHERFFRTQNRSHTMKIAFGQGDGANEWTAAAKPKRFAQAECRQPVMLFCRECEAELHSAAVS